MIEESQKKTTVEEIKAGNCGELKPEFCRTEDVRRLFGIRRGTLYSLLKQGRIKGVLLRVTGQKAGVRLWSYQSIANYIRALMECQTGKLGSNSNEG